MRVHIIYGREQCRSEIGHLPLELGGSPVVVQCIKLRFEHKHHEGWTPEGEYVVWHNDDDPCSACCPITSSEKEIA